MMKNRLLNHAFELLAAVVVDVLNPLLVIALALFVSVGYLLTLLTPVDIFIWVLILCGSVLAPIPFLSYRARKRWSARIASAGSLDWRVVLPILPLLIFVPLFLAELNQPGLQILYHGDLHVGYVHNILYRPTPVDNIFLAGHPANYYWLYHAFLAALVELTGAAPPLVASAISILAILSSLLWLAQIIEGLGIASKRSLTLGLATVVVYCAVNATGVLSLAESYMEGSFQADSLRVMLPDAADRRLHSTMGKVMNFTSMALAMACFTVALHSAVTIASGNINRLVLALVTSAWLVTLALQPVIAMLLLIVFPSGLLVTGLLVGFGDSGGRLRFGSFWSYLVSKVGDKNMLAWLLISVVLSLPLVHYIVQMTAGPSSSIRITQDIRFGVSMVAAATLLFLPLFAMQTRFAFKRKIPAEYLIQVSGIIAILLTVMLALPDNNQYKMVFCLAMMLAISGFSALRLLFGSGNQAVRVAASIICAVIVVLTFARIAYVKVYYDVRALTWSFGYDGRHIDYYAYIFDAKSLTWLRSETPADSIVLLPPAAHNYSHLVHERRAYVRKSQFWFTDGFPQYQVRLDRLEAVYREETATEQFQRIIAEMTAEFPGEKIYAVASDAEMRFETMIDRGARRVFTHPTGRGHVYLLNP